MDSIGIEGRKEIASGSAIVIREYLDEMRKQGRINGELSIVVKDGKKERRLPLSFPIARDALRPPMGYRRVTLGASLGQFPERKWTLRVARFETATSKKCPLFQKVMIAMPRYSGCSDQCRYR